MKPLPAADSNQSKQHLVRWESRQENVIEHVRAGHINPKGLITHKVPLEDVADAYQIFAAKLDGCIKPVLVPSNA